MCSNCPVVSRASHTNQHSSHYGKWNACFYPVYHLSILFISFLCWFTCQVLCEMFALFAHTAVYSKNQWGKRLSFHLHHSLIVASLFAIFLFLESLFSCWVAVWGSVNLSHIYITECHLIPPPEPSSVNIASDFISLNHSSLSHLLPCQWLHHWFYFHIISDFS